MERESSSCHLETLTMERLMYNMYPSFFVFVRSFKPSWVPSEYKINKGTRHYYIYLWKILFMHFY